MFQHKIALFKIQVCKLEAAILHGTIDEISGQVVVKIKLRKNCANERWKAFLGFMCSVLMQDTMLALYFCPVLVPH
eukprot:10090545-Ditylum_brightwellii.AAC.1